MQIERDITTEFRHMRIHLPKVDEVHEGFDRLRNSRKAALNDNRMTSTEAGCITIFAPSHAGKTTIVDWYAEKNFPDASKTDRKDGPSPQKKVVVVNLNGVSTQKSLLSRTLMRFGDPLPLKGGCDEMLYRLLNYIAKCGTELVAFDEANNLRMRTARDLDATRTHNTLRAIPKLAGCPVVFIGTEEAEARILSDTQISNIDFPVQLTPLSLNIPGEAKVLREYCSSLGILLREVGLFKGRSNFVRENTLSCLVTAGGGLPGRISRLVERAAYIARSANADFVDFCHLEEATDLYAIPHRFVKLNPFTADRIRRNKAA